MEYKIFNTIENKIVFESTYLEYFIEFVKLICKENEDYDFSILGLSDAKEYIENYCDNLILITQIIKNN